MAVLTIPIGCAHQGLSTITPKTDDLAIRETEFDLYQSVFSSDRQNAVSLNPEMQRELAEEFLKKKLYARAAQESGHISLDSLRRRFALLDQSVIAHFYEWTFIGENLGAARGEIESYFTQHPEKFGDSTGHNPSFRSVLNRVADTLALSKANLDSFYTVNSENYLRAEPELRLGMNRKYLIEAKQQRIEWAATDLKSKYKVRIVHIVGSPSDTQIESYFAQNQDAYKSPEAFDLYHIETSMPNALRSKIADVKSLEEFKALANRTSENTWSKSLGGHLGPVKRDFCFPFGIGMMPTLFPMLDTSQVGKILEPLQSNPSGKWHFFWLAKKLPRTQKPFSRVRFLVYQDIITNGFSEFHPDDTLAVIPGRRAILEKDISFLRDEYPVQLRATFTRENLLDFLLDRTLMATEAETLGLLKDERLQALRLANQLSFWSRFYEDSVLHPGWKGDTSALSALFSRKSSVFTRDSSQRDWHAFGRDLAAYSLLTQNELEIELKSNRERYVRGDSLPRLEDVEFDVFNNLKMEAYRKLDKKVLNSLQAQFQPRIDSALVEPKKESAEQIVAKAEKSHRNKHFDHALYLYRKVRETFPERPALQCSVGLSMAKIHLEHQRYQQALAEYRRIGLLYPADPSHQKALFMEGFILAEYFKSDSAAVRAFEKLQKQYPDGELSKEADWMIRNIRSGGALMSP